MEKRLYRSRKKKVIAGLCGGLGEYLDIDPVILRIIFVLITIFHGIGVIVYIIMWIIVQEEPYDKSFTEESKEPETENETKKESTFTNNSKQATESPSSSNGRIVIGVLLIIIGLVFLSEKFFPFFDFEFVFALGLIGFGIALIINFFNRSEKSS